MSADIRILKTAKLTEEQKKLLTGAPVLDPEELDAAIIGAVETTEGLAAVYDYDLLIELFQRDDPESTREDVKEFISYNTVRMLEYLGPRAPWILEEAEVPNSCNEEEDPLVEFNGKKWWRHS